MLKKMITKKIIVSSLCLFALFLIYMIPKDTIYTLKDIEQEVNYVNQNENLKTVFLMDQDGMLGKTEYVSDIIDENDINRQVTDAISVLIKDGVNESKVPNGFQAVISSDTKIISSSFEDGVYKINFSSELLDVKQDMEEKVIEAIVFTATSNQNVKQVIIYVDGDTLTYLPKSKTYIPATLDRNFGINKTFDITNTDNIDDLVNEIIKANNNVKNSSSNSDWRLFGEDMQTLTSLIDQLENIVSENANQNTTNEVINETIDNTINSVEN